MTGRQRQKNVKWLEPVWTSNIKGKKIPATARPAKKEAPNIVSLNIENIRLFAGRMETWQGRVRKFRKKGGNSDLAQTGEDKNWREGRLHREKEGGKEKTPYERGTNPSPESDDRGEG